MTAADQIDALRRHNATLREWLDRAKADAEKMREERDAALAEVARLSEALDAAGKLVKRYNVSQANCRDCEALSYHGGSGRCGAHR